MSSILLEALDHLRAMVRSGKQLNSAAAKVAGFYHLGQAELVRAYRAQP